MTNAQARSIEDTLWYVVDKKRHISYKISKDHNQCKCDEKCTCYTIAYWDRLDPKNKIEIHDVSNAFEAGRFVLELYPEEN